jgi:hypothetical protein
MQARVKDLIRHPDQEKRADELHGKWQTELEARDAARAEYERLKAELGEKEKKISDLRHDAKLLSDRVKELTGLNLSNPKELAAIRERKAVKVEWKDYAVGKTECSDAICEWILLRVMQSAFDESSWMWSIESRAESFDLAKSAAEQAMAELCCGKELSRAEKSLQERTPTKAEASMIDETLANKSARPKMPLTRVQHIEPEPSTPQAGKKPLTKHEARAIALDTKNSEYD